MSVLVYSFSLASHANLYESKFEIKPFDPTTEKA